jgi:hypothetical protein
MSGSDTDEHSYIARAVEALSHEPSPVAIEAGRLASVIRRAYRHLSAVQGFETARNTVAEIINSEAERPSKGQA